MAEKNSTKLSKQRILAPMGRCFRKDPLVHKIIPLYAPIGAGLLPNARWSSVWKLLRSGKRATFF